MNTIVFNDGEELRVEEAIVRLAQRVTRLENDLKAKDRELDFLKETLLQTLRLNCSVQPNK